MNMRAILVAACLAVTAPVPAVAQGGRDVDVRFAAGTSSATYRDSIRGYRTIDYVVRARAGQRLTVSMRTSNASSYFNVSAPGAPEALFNGSVSGNSFAGRLPSGGEYRIRVYLMRNAARRNETARFTLTVSVDGGAAQPPGDDYADGLSRGPDFWRVSGLRGGDRLNIRTAPSPRARIVWRLNEGTILRNLGCRMAGGMRWCRVGLTEDRAIDGWVNGRFLRESGPPRPRPR